MKNSMFNIVLRFVVGLGTVGATFSAQAFDELPLSQTRSYSDVASALRALAAQYPDQVQLFELGINDEGKAILGLKIGKGPVHNLVVGTHHGNEYGATAVAEALAADLAKTPIEGQTIHVIPVLNTWGYDRRNRREKGPTSSTFDPNRDYPGPCGTDGPFNLRSTKALADYLDVTPIVNSVTMHTYWPAVLYPWGISTAEVDTGYTDLFIELGMHAAFMSGYKVANSTQELYPADGTFEDYAYWKHGIWSMLFEMGTSHTPSSSAIQEMIRVNVPGVRRMFEYAPVVRAPDFSFKGKCNGLARILDRRDE